MLRIRKTFSLLAFKSGLQGPSYSKSNSRIILSVKNYPCLIPMTIMVGAKCWFGHPWPIQSHPKLDLCSKLESLTFSSVLDSLSYSLVVISLTYSSMLDNLSYSSVEKSLSYSSCLTAWPTPQCWKAWPISQYRKTQPTPQCWTS